MNPGGELSRCSQWDTFWPLTPGLFLLPPHETIWRVNEQPSYLVPTPKFFIPAQVEMLNASSSALLTDTSFFFCVTVQQKTQRNCLLPPCSSSLALGPLGSPGTIMPFFQAIAKPNLPHKLIGPHLKSEGDGVKEKTRERATEGEGQRRNNNKPTDQTEKHSYTTLWDHFWIRRVLLRSIQVSLGNVCRKKQIWWHSHWHINCIVCLLGGTDWCFSWEGAAASTVWGGE